MIFPFIEYSLIKIFGYYGTDYRETRNLRFNVVST
jgi:hypothetical protein